MSVARAVLGLAFAATTVSAQDMTFFSVGSGSITGSYYAAARAICAEVNAAPDDLRCSAEPTSGSLYNLSALADEQVDFALVQSDWQRFAYEGKDVFARTGPMTELRSVMALYPEAVTVLARSDSRISGPDDLVGKRIDIGPPTSGRYATLTRLMDALGTDRSSFAELTNFADAAAIAELCEGRLDAVVLIVGHPNQAVAQALTDCDVTIAPLSGAEIDAALGPVAEYIQTTIPLSTYPQLTADIRTHAVTATLVTRADTSAELVAAVLGRTLENLDELKAGNRLLANLDPEGMATHGLSAPLHPAAAATFGTFEAAAARGQ